MGLNGTKPAFGGWQQSETQISSATETSWKIEILLVASPDMVLSKKRITKAVIRLRGCAGWSAPSLFSNS